MKPYLNVLLSAVVLSGWMVSGSLRAANSIFPSTKGSTWKYVSSDGRDSTVSIIMSSARHVTVKSTGAMTLVRHFVRNAYGWNSREICRVQMHSVRGGRPKIDIVQASGVVIPRTVLWKPRFTWSYSMQASASASSGPYSASVKARVHCRCRITGVKKIQVPAGVFRCFRVEVISETTTHKRVLNHTHIRHIKAHCVEYFAKGVGLVEVIKNHVTRKLARYHIAR
jgi:hypothetical protein